MSCSVFGLGTELGASLRTGIRTVLEFKWQMSWEFYFEPGLRAELGAKQRQRLEIELGALG